MALSLTLPSSNLKLPIISYPTRACGTIVNYATRSRGVSGIGENGTLVAVFVQLNPSWGNGLWPLKGGWPLKRGNHNRKALIWTLMTGRLIGVAV